MSPRPSRRAFFVPSVLTLKRCWHEMLSGVCTGMALKGAICECGRKRGRSCGRKGVGALAYDKDLNGNMY